MNSASEIERGREEGEQARQGRSERLVKSGTVRERQFSCGSGGGRRGGRVERQRRDGNEARLVADSKSLDLYQLSSLAICVRLSPAPSVAVAT